MNVTLSCFRQLNLKYYRGLPLQSIRKMCDNSERRIIEFKIPVPWGYIAGIIQVLPLLHENIMTLISVQLYTVIFWVSNTSCLLRERMG